MFCVIEVIFFYDSTLYFVFKISNNKIIRVIAAPLKFLIMEKSQKIVRMEDIIETKLEENKNKKQKVENKNPAVIKGKPKSGRFWKSEKKKFSSIIKTKGIRNSLKKKQELKEKMKHIKELSDTIKAAKKEEVEQRKERRRDNLKRQEENRKKSEVVQVISNTKKLKKMKKKQLRSIEKRDTTVVSKM